MDLTRRDFIKTSAAAATATAAGMQIPAAALAASGEAESGEEQAAEIVAWGLMLAPAPIPTSVGQYGPQDDVSLSAAFEVLTDSAPLFGSR